MLRVLPAKKQTLQRYLLQDRFERGRLNAQHRYSTRLAASLFWDRRVRLVRLGEKSRHVESRKAYF